MGHQNLRKGRCSIPGQIYAITFVTYQRAKIIHPLTGRLIGTTTLSPNIIKDHQLLCWVAMPDHCHLLLQLGHDESLSQFVANFKRSASVQIKKALKRSSAVWEDGFYDHALRAEEDIQTLARYIIANPLRAKLVTSIRDYPYWNAIWV